MNLRNLASRSTRTSQTTATLVAFALLGLLVLAAPLAALPHQEPELGECTQLQPPAGSKLVSHVYAEGVQIYEWNGTSWGFVAPEAILFANAGGTGAVGIHYQGPKWESRSGSKVGGMAIERCTPDPDSIQWLLLVATTSSGPGIFHRVTHIQRVNTVGGIAPMVFGDTPGQRVGVPYTTEYYFYRAP